MITNHAKDRNRRLALDDRHTTGKIRFTGCQSLLIGRNRAYRVQTSRILLKAAAVVWMPFPRDIVLLASALLTLPQFVEALPCCCGDQTPKRWGPINAGEYLRRKRAAMYARKV